MAEQFLSADSMAGQEASSSAPSKKTSSRRGRSTSQDAADKIRAKAISSRKTSRAEEKGSGEIDIPSPVLTDTVVPPPQPALQTNVAVPLNWSPEGDREQFSVFPTENLEEAEQFLFDCLTTGIEPQVRDRAFNPEATFMPTVAGLCPVDKQGLVCLRKSNSSFYKLSLRE
ncbi:hypothetical protein E2320_002154 [Naja naja]|nr:hypothetical protein E2320_002154 [Naja naja]